MASIALDPAYRRVSVEEFLEMDFGGAKAELEDGIIFMMAGGNEAHARIAANLIIALGTRLRGTGCRPYGSDFATRTKERNVRYPDVSIYCGHPSDPANASKKLLGDPVAVFEVLSPSTSSHDQIVKLAEYRARAGIADIVFLDPDSERVRRVSRIRDDDWTDVWVEAGADLHLPSLDLVVPHADIFARD